MRWSLAAPIAAAAVAISVAATGCSALEEAAAESASFDCDDLAADAVRISEEQESFLSLLKVRNPQVVTDNRDTYAPPSGDGENLILECSGMGVWSDGSNSPVSIQGTIDADGDVWVKYEGE